MLVHVYDLLLCLYGEGNVESSLKHSVSISFNSLFGIKAFDLSRYVYLQCLKKDMVIPEVCRIKTSTDKNSNVFKYTYPLIH